MNWKLFCEMEAIGLIILDMVLAFGLGLNAHLFNATEFNLYCIVIIVIAIIAALFLTYAYKPKEKETEQNG